MIIKKYFWIIIILTIAVVILPSRSLRLSVKEAKNFENDYVPDSLTAIRVAEAIIDPIYGEGFHKSQRPFRAYLKDSVWYVSGAIKNNKRFGGTVYVEIQKRDCRIIDVWRSK